MTRNGWTALVIVVAVAAEHWGGHVPFREDVPQFQGTWVIASVQKNGEPDAEQVGATMTFAAAAVTFQPAAVAIDDGTG